MRLFTLACLLLCLTAVSAHAENKAATPGSPPEWYMEDVTFLTAGNGRWVADNSEYQNENEPFDAYGVEWTAKYGGMMVGRLFGLIEGEEKGEFWHFVQYWDARTGTAILTQFHPSGGSGIGRLWEEGNAVKSQQTFIRPDGARSESGHIARKPDPFTHETDSYDIEGDEWSLRRKYIWRRAKDNNAN